MPSLRTRILAYWWPHRYGHRRTASNVWRIKVNKMPGICLNFADISTLRGVVSSRMTPPQARWLAECFDEDEKNVNNRLCFSQSPCCAGFLFTTWVKCVCVGLKNLSSYTGTYLTWLVHVRGRHTAAMFLSSYKTSISSIHGVAHSAIPILGCDIACNIVM